MKRGDSGSNPFLGVHGLYPKPRASENNGSSDGNRNSSSDSDSTASRPPASSTMGASKPKASHPLLGPHRFGSRASDRNGFNDGPPASSTMDASQSKASNLLLASDRTGSSDGDSNTSASGHGGRSTVQEDSLSHAKDDMICSEVDASSTSDNSRSFTQFKFSTTKSNQSSATNQGSKLDSTSNSSHQATNSRPRKLLRAARSVVKNIVEGGTPSLQAVSIKATSSQPNKNVLRDTIRNSTPNLSSEATLSGPRKHILHAAGSTIEGSTSNLQALPTASTLSGPKNKVLRSASNAIKDSTPNLQGVSSETQSTNGSPRHKGLSKVIEGATSNLHGALKPTTESAPNSTLNKKLIVSSAAALKPTEAAANTSTSNTTLDEKPVAPPPTLSDDTKLDCSGNATNATSAFAPNESSQVNSSSIPSQALMPSTNVNLGSLPAIQEHGIPLPTQESNSSSNDEPSISWSPSTRENQPQSAHFFQPPILNGTIPTASINRGLPSTNARSGGASPAGSLFTGTCIMAVALYSGQKRKSNRNRSSSSSKIRRSCCMSSPRSSRKESKTQDKETAQPTVAPSPASAVDDSDHARLSHEIAGAKQQQAPLLVDEKHHDHTSQPTTRFLFPGPTSKANAALAEYEVGGKQASLEEPVKRPSVPSQATYSPHDRIAPNAPGANATTGGFLVSMKRPPFPSQGTHSLQDSIASNSKTDDNGPKILFGRTVAARIPARIPAAIPVALQQQMESDNHPHNAQCLQQQKPPPIVLAKPTKRQSKPKLVTKAFERRPVAEAGSSFLVTVSGNQPVARSDESSRPLHDGSSMPKSSGHHHQQQAPPAPPPPPPPLSPPPLSPPPQLQEDGPPTLELGPNQPPLSQASTMGGDLKRQDLPAPQAPIMSSSKASKVIGKKDDAFENDTRAHSSPARTPPSKSDAFQQKEATKATPLVNTVAARNPSSKSDAFQQKQSTKATPLVDAVPSDVKNKGQNNTKDTKPTAPTPTTLPHPVQALPSEGPIENTKPAAATPNNPHRPSQTYCTSDFSGVATFDDSAFAEADDDRNSTANGKTSWNAAPSPPISNQDNSSTRASPDAAACFDGPSSRTASAPLIIGAGLKEKPPGNTAAPNLEQEGRMKRDSAEDTKPAAVAKANVTLAPRIPEQEDIRKDAKPAAVAKATVTSRAAPPNSELEDSTEDAKPTAVVKAIATSHVAPPNPEQEDRTKKDIMEDMKPTAVTAAVLLLPVAIDASKKSNSCRDTDKQQCNGKHVATDTAPPTVEALSDREHKQVAAPSDSEQADEHGIESTDNAKATVSVSEASDNHSKSGPISSPRHPRAQAQPTGIMNHDRPAIPSPQPKAHDDPPKKPSPRPEALGDGNEDPPKENQTESEQGDDTMSFGGHDYGDFQMSDLDDEEEEQATSPFTKTNPLVDPTQLDSTNTGPDSPNDDGTKQPVLAGSTAANGTESSDINPGSPKAGDKAPAGDKSRTDDTQPSTVVKPLAPSTAASLPRTNDDAMNSGDQDDIDFGMLEQNDNSNSGSGMLGQDIDDKEQATSPSAKTDPPADPTPQTNPPMDTTQRERNASSDSSHNDDAKQTQTAASLVARVNDRTKFTHDSAQRDDAHQPVVPSTAASLPRTNGMQGRTPAASIAANTQPQKEASPTARANNGARTPERDAAHQPSVPSLPRTNDKQAASPSRANEKQGLAPPFARTNIEQATPVARAPSPAATRIGNETRTSPAFFNNDESETTAPVARAPLPAETPMQMGGGTQTDSPVLHNDDETTTPVARDARSEQQSPAASNNASPQASEASQSPIASRRQPQFEDLETSRVKKWAQYQKHANKKADMASMMAPWVGDPAVVSRHREPKLRQGGKDLSDRKDIRTCYNRYRGNPKWKWFFVPGAIILIQKVEGTEGKWKVKYYYLDEDDDRFKLGTHDLAETFLEEIYQVRIIRLAKECSDQDKSAWINVSKRTFHYSVIRKLIWDGVRRRPGEGEGYEFFSNNGQMVVFDPQDNIFRDLVLLSSEEATGEEDDTRQVLPEDFQPEADRRAAQENSKPIKFSCGNTTMQDYIFAQPEVAIDPFFKPQSGRSYQCLVRNFTAAAFHMEDRHDLKSRAKNVLKNVLGTDISAVPMDKRDARLCSLIATNMRGYELKGLVNFNPCEMDESKGDKDRLILYKPKGHPHASAIGNLKIWEASLEYPLALDPINLMKQCGGDYRGIEWAYELSTQPDSHVAKGKKRKGGKNGKKNKNKKAKKS